MLYLHHVPVFFFFPFCANHFAWWFPCVSGFRSFKRWLDASGEAVRQGTCGVGGGFASCAVFCCLLPNVFCLAMREYVYVYIRVCVCVCLINSFRLFQIGTGFKDEDLEQHYKFLKVKRQNKTVDPRGLVKIKTQLILKHWFIFFKPQLQLLTFCSCR